ncbi:DUF2993 domain-containing protein [Micromonospora sp. WMMD1128]|uniref:LmeA family phospholipid-binding protein n=1 Tax=Micromonospora sp. WMMD1128 TaxID=3015150 RepID=UPI00248B7095|nr:DUF2993 domain-containing protein [Micromonospora sp. WMMD1128]WBB76194.1 DUF2993 domain-containing protein [Micromonospora sp. WMMD1128]
MRKFTRRRLLAGTAVLFLVVAAVVADRVAARLVAGRLADRLACAAGVPRPSVELSGFPVLPQVLGGRLDRLRVGVTDARAGGLRVARADADLRNVRSGDGPARIGAAAVEVLVGYAALPTEAAGRTLRYRYADGLLGVETQMSTVPVTLLVRPTLTGGRLTFTPSEVEVFGIRRPAGKLLDRLGGGPDLGRDLPALPTGLSYRSVTATADGLLVRVDGHDLTLPAAGGRTGARCGGA